VSDPFEVVPPSFLPDIYDGSLFSGLFALPVANLRSDRTLKNIKVTIENQPETTSFKIQTIEKVLTVAPGQTRPIACLISSGPEVVSESFEDIYLKLKISTSEGSNFFGVTLKCRKSDESFVFTFQDHDGSVQRGAAIKPIKDCPKGCF